jgi:hypothetical protein
MDEQTAPASDPAPKPAAQRLATIHARLDGVLSASSSRDVLELAMATAISQRVTARATPPVWLLLVGPPSVGKTAGADLLRETEAAKLTIFVNSMSREALASGFVDKKTGKRAPWLLNELDGRCWVDTELNALLNEDDRAVAKFMGALTAAFDGTYSKAIGSSTGPSSVIRSDSRFSLIGCVTPETLAKHSHHLRSLGPRFLTYRVLPLTAEEEQRGFELLRDGARRTAALAELRQLTRTHLVDRLAEYAAEASVTVPAEQEPILEALAKIVAFGRTAVRWEGTEPAVGDVEGPFRVYQQLRALLVALAVVHGTPSPSPRALRLVRDVALASIMPARADVILAQRQAPVWGLVPRNGEPQGAVTGVTPARVAEVMGKTPQHARDTLEELVAVGLYERRQDVDVIGNDGPGRPRAFYSPVSGLAAVLSNPFEPWPGTPDLSDLAILSPVDSRWVEPILRALVDAKKRGTVPWRPDEAAGSDPGPG